MEPLFRTENMLKISEGVVFYSTKNVVGFLKVKSRKPGDVNRIFRLPNQSKSIESNRMIKLRLVESIERQSNLHFFPLDWIQLEFD